MAATKVSSKFQLRISPLPMSCISIRPNALNQTSASLHGCKSWARFKVPACKLQALQQKLRAGRATFAPYSAEHQHAAETCQVRTMPAKRCCSCST